MSANPRRRGASRALATGFQRVCGRRAAAGGSQARRCGCSGFIRDVIARNPETFRLFGPDETASNRLASVFEVTDRAFTAEIVPGDDHLAPDGRVLEVLSEHLCRAGWRATS